MGNDNKKTFTYATTEKIKKKAAKKAAKEGITLSEKIHDMLKGYVEEKKKPAIVTAGVRVLLPDLTKDLD